MRGTMIIINLNGTHETIRLTKAPSLDDLQTAVGGNIETVPYFDTFLTETGTHRCVAFCNEEGKLHGLPLNPRANELWQLAVGRPIRDDYLVGRIAIVTGDDALLESL